MLEGCRSHANERRRITMNAATYSSLVRLAVGGKYEVHRVFGIGGMGVVCEAVHLDLGKKVAMKRNRQDDEGERAHRRSLQA